MYAVGQIIRRLLPAAAVCAFLLTLASSTASGQQTCEFRNRTPAPESTITETQPQVAVIIQCQQAVGSVRVLLDGTEVAFEIAGPTPEQQTVFFQPESPLSAGRHTITVEVVGDGQTSWTFSVGPTEVAPAGGGYGALRELGPLTLPRLVLLTGVFGLLTAGSLVVRRTARR